MGWILLCQYYFTKHLYSPSFHFMFHGLSLFIASDTLVNTCIIPVSSHVPSSFPFDSTLSLRLPTFPAEGFGMGCMAYVGLEAWDSGFKAILTSLRFQPGICRTRSFKAKLSPAPQS